MTHICVSKTIIIGSDTGLSPGRHQTIIWISVGILLIGPLGTNFSENVSEIYTFSFKKMHLKMSSAKWRPFCLGLNLLILIACVPQVPIMDMAGRRMLLLIPMVIMVVDLAILTMALVLQVRTPCESSRDLIGPLWMTSWDHDTRIAPQNLE